jgi:hypothetical protein
MRPFSGHRIVRGSAAVLLGAIFGLLIVPGVATGASVTFGTPSASSTFGKGIVFTQPYSGGGINHAEILIELPGDLGPSVSVLQSPGSSSLTYTLDTSGGGLSPFIPVTAHFQVFFDDGTAQDGPDIQVTYADDRFAWKAKSGKVVTIHWFQGTDAFAQQLLAYGEQGLSKSAAFMGIDETKPVDFYIYPSQSAFQAGLSVAETIGGLTESTYRTCFALVAPNDLAYGSDVVPHELTHIVFGDITDNPYHSPPRWLNEGLAVYEAVGYGSDDRQLVAQAVKGGTLVPLAALAGYFASDPNRIYLSYAESVSAVDFMVRKYGQSAIQKLLKTYGQGATDDEAFTAAFGIGMDAFNESWLANIGVPAPTEYGPQPAPTGPIPPGWTGSSATTPPLEPTASTATGSSPPGGQGTTRPNGSNSSALVLAGLIALGGLILLGVGILLYVESQPGRTYPDGPPPS